MTKPSVHLSRWRTNRQRLGDLAATGSSALSVRPLPTDLESRSVTHAIGPALAAAPFTSIHAARLTTWGRLLT